MDDGLTPGQAAEMYSEARRKYREAIRRAREREGRWYAWRQKYVLRVESVLTQATVNTESGRQ